MRCPLCGSDLVYERDWPSNLGTVRLLSCPSCSQEDLLDHFWSQVLRLNEFRRAQAPTDVPPPQGGAS